MEVIRGCYAQGIEATFYIRNPKTLSDRREIVSDRWRGLTYDGDHILLLSIANSMTYPFHTVLGKG